MANLSLVFDLIGRDVSASRAFKGVGDSAERAGKQGESFGGLVSKGLKLASGALLGAGLIEGFKSLYDAAAESAKIGRLTEQVIKSTGGTAGVTAKQVGDLAGALAKKTGIDDEAIQSGQNLLLTFTNIQNKVGKGNDIFNQATATITDMSVALGQDTSTSAIQLGKALNDPIKGVTALQKVGVSFTQSQKDQIRTLVESGDTMAAQKIILGELSKEFGGAAEAASTPFGKLQQKLGDLAESLGNELIPYVDRFANFMMDEVLPAVSDVGGVISGTLGPALGVAVDLFKSLFEVAGGVVGFIADLPGPLQAVAIGFGALAILQGPLGALFGRGGLIDGGAIRFLMFKDAVAGAVTSTSGFKNAIGKLAGAFSPATLAIGAAFAALPLLVDGFKKLAGITDVASGAQKRFKAALEDTNGVIAGNVRKAAQDVISNTEGMVGAFDKAGVSARDAIDGLLGNAAAQERVNQALQNYITTSISNEGRGNKNATAAADARNAYADLVPTLGAARAEQDFFGSSTDSATTATEGQTSALGAAQPVVDTFAQGLQDTADAADDARKSTDLFKGALDALTGASVDITEVESAFWEELDKAKDALKDATGAVLDNSGALNLHSDAGRKTRDTLVGLASDADAWIATMKTQGASTADLQAKDAELRAAFYKTALQMTGNKDAAQALTDKYYGIPAQRNTLITADTRTAAQQVDDFVALMSKKTIKVTVLAGAIHSVGGLGGGGGSIANADGGIVHAYAGGGFEPMRGGTAKIVAPNTFRIIGDRVRDDEAYIPINNSARSRAILQQTNERMGFSTAAGSSTPSVHIDNFHAGGQSPMEVAESLTWLARTRG